jgi:hypothetical protein
MELLRQIKTFTGNNSVNKSIGDYSILLMG